MRSSSLAYPITYTHTHTKAQTHNITHTCVAASTQPSAVEPTVAAAALMRTPTAFAGAAMIAETQNQVATTQDMGGKDMDLQR